MTAHWEQRDHWLPPNKKEGWGFGLKEKSGFFLSDVHKWVAKAFYLLMKSSSHLELLVVLMSV